MLKGLWDAEIRSGSTGVTYAQGWADEHENGIASDDFDWIDGSGPAWNPKNVALTKDWFQREDSYNRENMNLATPYGALKMKIAGVDVFDEMG